MAKTINKVTLVGNVGKDPEVKAIPSSGTMVANFSLATSYRFKDKAGEWQDQTEWHNLTAYARLAEIIRDYVKKGAKLYVEGRLQTRSWDDAKSGEKKYRTEIVVGELVLLGGKADSDREEQLGYGKPAPKTNREIDDSAFIDPSDLPF